MLDSGPAHQHSLACPTDCAVPAAGTPAVRRLAAVAMPELLTATRTPTVRRHSAVGGATLPDADARPGLASGFGPSVTVVPAAVAGSSAVANAAAGAALAVPAAGLAATPPRPSVRRSALSSAVGAPSTPGSTTLSPRSAAAAAGTTNRPSRGQAAPVASGSASTAASGPVTIVRSYLPAPPPISIRPAPVSGPEIPAAARGLGSDAGRDALPAVVRRSLADTLGRQSPAGLAESTAHLFQAARLADAPIRRTTETSGGSPVTTPGQFTVRRTLGQTAFDPTTSGGADLDIDDIVERVIDKIEQRVVDELERRGRYNSDGAF